MPRNKVLETLVPRFVWPSRVMRGPIWKATGGQTMIGPFAGMQYVEGAVGGSYLPKLVGTYEMELTDQIEAIVAMQPRRLIDVGAAEGYYAVGFAKRIPGCTVVSYEMNPKGRDLHRKLAELNCVADRNDIRGECTPEVLAACLAETDDPPLIVCDVEAYEGVLMDPEEIPALREATILVEVHDLFQPGLSELLRGRFDATHDITNILSKPRSVKDYPFSAWWQKVFPQRYVIHPLHECRPVQMNWFWMTPKAA